MEAKGEGSVAPMRLEPWIKENRGILRFLGTLSTSLRGFFEKRNLGNGKREAKGNAAGFKLIQRRQP